MMARVTRQRQMQDDDDTRQNPEQRRVRSGQSVDNGLQPTFAMRRDKWLKDNLGITRPPRQGASARDNLVAMRTERRQESQQRAEDRRRAVSNRIDARKKRQQFFASLRSQLGMAPQWELTTNRRVRSRLLDDVDITRRN